MYCQHFLSQVVEVYLQQRFEEIAGFQLVEAVGEQDLHLGNNYSQYDVLMGIGSSLSNSFGDAVGVRFENLCDFWHCHGTLVVDFCMERAVPLMMASTLGIRYNIQEEPDYIYSIKMFQIDKTLRNTKNKQYSKVNQRIIVLKIRGNSI